VLFCVMEPIYEEIQELCLCADSKIMEDQKGRIEDGIHRTVVFLDEQRRHPRPLGPAISHPETNPKKYVCRAGD